ncbi:unnamed protein product [Ceutorhynchus assimilis]|uniref:Protein takeout n=1 Tax=Ceutorhynchus assimilis TaxID=467358 RepID=A0A9N9MPT6_9CUCU|nr:unnamed protein product [Ceutorhynchus assimilis]
MHLIFLFGFLAVFAERGYAASFTFCKSSDDGCLVKNIQSAITSLKSGNSEYGLKSLDPLSVDKMTIGAGSGPVQLVQKYDHLTLSGLTDITVNKAHYDAQKKSLQMLATVPKVTQKGHYALDGAILTLPVVGDGQSTITLENVEFTLNFQFEETKKGDQTYFKIKSVTNSIEPKHMTLNFENLFNGNNLLGDNINKLVNEEWRALYNDVQSDEGCLVKSIQSAITSLKSGNSEYGLKPLDPLSVDKMTIGAGSGPVQLVQNYDNVALSGLTDMTVNKAHYDAQKKSLQILATVPKLTQKGHYALDGAILTLPVVGDGAATLTLENIEFTLEFQFEETKKGGQTHFKIKTVAHTAKPNHMTLNFENLFNGNKLLGDNINKLVNEEWRTVYHDVRGNLESSYAEIYRKYAQDFFDKVPVDKLFLN